MYSITHFKVNTIFKTVEQQNKYAKEIFFTVKQVSTDNIEMCSK